MVPVLALGKSFHGESVIIQKSNLPVSDKLAEFCKSHSLNIISKAGITILTTLSLAIDSKGHEFIYGGKAFSKENGLLVGTGDIQRTKADISTIKESCGEYHLILFHGNKVEFRADWFGYQPLFYFNADFGGVISTSYHLLLLILKVLGVEFYINIPHALDIVKEKFTFTSSLSVEVDRCTCNRSYEYYEISQEKISVNKTSSYGDLYVDGEYSPAIYEDHILAAKSEIIEHVRMVFEHPAFDYIVVDLSGGFDTRLVYAACSVLPASLIRPKIRISTRHSSTPNDFEVAAMINYVYGYSYFDDPSVCNLMPTHSDKANIFYANNISKNLGTYKDWSGWSFFDSFYVTNVASIYGGCGDVYHGFEMQNTKQLDNYIENRNRFHFRQPFRNSYPVLMSKSAAKISQLYRRRHNHSEWKKVSIDILSLLNPLLATFPYANKEINEFFLDSTKVSKLYNYPNAAFATNQRIVLNNYVPLFTEDSKKGDLIYDPVFIKYIASRISSISTEFKAIIDQQLEIVLANPRGTTIIYRWWSLFFVMEIIDGHGDLS